MTALEPGTPVRVFIEGTVRRSSPITVDSGGGGMFMGISDDPYVTVTPLDPERPTLDRDAAIADAMNKLAEGRLGPHPLPESYCESVIAGVDAVLALIQAAHPEWTP